jgi:poly-beta-hydroxyalkanoate depolymerase
MKRLKKEKAKRRIRIYLEFVRILEKYLLFKLQIVYNKYAKYPLKEGSFIQFAGDFKSEKKENQGKMDLIEKMVKDIACTHQAALNMNTKELYYNIKSLLEYERQLDCL